MDDAVRLQNKIAGGGAFRVHDLSRRRVEFELRSGVQSLYPRSAPPIEEDDPFVHLGVANVAATPQSMTPPPASSINVPTWMHNGFALPPTATNVVPQCAASAYRPAGFLGRATESRRFGFYALMSDIACQYGIPTGLFDAMIIRESGYQPAIYSAKKAFGLAQLMPETAAGLGVNRYDIEQNLRGGAQYLRQQLDRFGQVHLALAAYNAGPGRVRNGVLPAITETRAYVDNVLLNWQRLAGLNRTIPAGRPAPPPLPLPLPRAKSMRVRTVSVSIF